jgi:hypothetical protein
MSAIDNQAGRDGSGAACNASGAMTMRQMSIALTAIIVFGPVAAANGQVARDQGPCGRITAACEAAGFTRGGIGTGTAPYTDLPSGLASRRPGEDLKLTWRKQTGAYPV